MTGSTDEDRQVLARDRSPRGAEPAPGDPQRRGQHRAPAHPSPWHGRAAIAAVATGATVAAGYTLGELPGEDYSQIAELASSALVQSTPTDLASRSRSVAAASAHASAKHGRHRRDRLDTPSEPDQLVDDASDVADILSLTKAVQFGEQLAERSRRLNEALADGAPRAAIYRDTEFVMPTNGRYTSGFGSRWGVVHYGIDLANKIGTPIYAVTEGTVISSGPASGFGMWVRLQHPGGWISVYGHINRSVVHIGEQVHAGEKIAEMGNRGESTGPHLHFEIWDPSGKKLNPLPWLTTRGIRVTGQSSGAGSD